MLKPTTISSTIMINTVRIEAFEKQMCTGSNLFQPHNHYIQQLV